MFCEKCGSLFMEKGRLCPACGSRKVRYPRRDDRCFLTEQEMPWSEMLADVLTRNEIFFVRQPVLGAGLALQLGQGMERHRFYVRYDQLDKARDLEGALFEQS